MVAERTMEKVARTETTDELVRYDILIAPLEGFRVRDLEAGGFDHQIRLLNISPIKLEVVDGNSPDSKQTAIVDVGKVYGKRESYRLYPQLTEGEHRKFIIVTKKGVEVESVESVEAD